MEVMGSQIHVGEVTCGGSPHLSWEMRGYMDMRVTSPTFFFLYFIELGCLQQNFIYKEFTLINSTRITIHLNYIPRKKEAEKTIINENKIIAQIIGYNTY